MELDAVGAQLRAAVVEAVPRWYVRIRGICASRVGNTALGEQCIETQ
ncbi:hypothetical protein [Dactylosporangium sp. CA-092794]